MSMEDGTLRRLELYLHDLHKKIDGIYDMLMLRHERETALERAALRASGSIS